MTSHPILFSGPMVRAILAGRKVQTRRIVKLGNHARANFGGFSDGVFSFYDSIPDDPCPLRIKCPYGTVGDRLWVRETFGILQRTDSTPGGQPYDPLVKYRAENPDYIPATPKDKIFEWRWRPSIHMPRWASRITLEVTNVRVERLRDITEEDATAEGVEHFKSTMSCLSDDQPFIGEPHKHAGQYPHRFSFACLWDEINGDRALWVSNPWIWVVKFRRVELST